MGIFLGERPVCCRNVGEVIVEGDAKDYRGRTGKF